MTMDENPIPLAALLEHISGELHKAHERATRDDSAVMRFKECELDFAIEVEGKASGEIKVWILKLGGGVKRTEKNTIKVKYAALDEDVVAAAEALEKRRGKPKRKGK
jgi:hypothetical protein